MKGLLRAIYKFIFFSIWGWEITGTLPVEKKYVLLVAPHTSNLDFLVGVFARRILDFNPRFLAKKELFRFPFGYFFRWMGGYPVERSQNTNFVEQMAAIFKKEDSFILTITPEGTRSYAAQWKTGFYYVAKAAHVPILPVAFDFANKQVHIGTAEYPGDDPEACLNKYKQYYSQFKGKNPELGVKWKE